MSGQTIIIKRGLSTSGWNSRLYLVLALVTLGLGLPFSSGPLSAQRHERLSPQILELIPGGGRMAWSTQGDKLAYDHPDPSRADGLFDIYVLDNALAGGANRRGRCLTCKVPLLRKVHAINPTFHPAGDQIVFQTVGLAKKTGINARDLNRPERSNRSEIWLARTDGKDFWKLTDFWSIGSAVLDPSFSFEGKRLVWAERYQSRQGTYGAWKLRSGAIRTKRGVPRLARLEVEFTPQQPALVLPQGFTPDDQGFLVAANLEPGQRVSGLDLYLVTNGKTQRLTRTGGIAEEVARFHPSGTTITFASSQTLRPTETADRQPVRELWSMDLDGNNQRRLTFFNEPPAKEYRGATFVGDFDWHPDGEWLAAQVVSGRNAEASIILIRWPSE